MEKITLLPNRNQVVPSSIQEHPYFNISYIAAGDDKTSTGKAASRIANYEIIWLSATPILRADESILEIPDDEIYFLVPGQYRNYTDTGLTGFRIEFSADYLQIGSSHARLSSWLDLFNPFKHTSRVRADAELKADLAVLFVKIKKEFSSHSELRTECLSGLLNLLLIEFSRRVENKTEILHSKDAELVRRFRSCLVSSYAIKKQVFDYASELCVTPNYLNRIVKKITGHTVSHHIHQHIILEAKRQALSPNSSMKEVAYLLGFDNLAHFSKFFKNKSGMNFTRFKKTVQVQQLPAAP